MVRVSWISGQARLQEGGNNGKVKVDTCPLVNTMKQCSGVSQPVSDTNCPVLVGYMIIVYLC